MVLRPNKCGVFEVTPDSLGREIVSYLSGFLHVHVTKEEVALMLGTAAVESDFRFLKQKGKGPARGYFQMEPATAISLMNNYLNNRPALLKKMMALMLNVPVPFPKYNLPISTVGRLLTYNLPYMILMTRLNYYKDPSKLPDFEDVKRLARYWKRVHNSIVGAGVEEDFIEKYEFYHVHDVVSSLVK